MNTPSEAVGFIPTTLGEVTPVLGRHWERPLLQYYLSRLDHYGARYDRAAPSFDEAWYLHRCSAVFPFLAWFNNSAVWQPESVNTRNTMRAAMAVIDHDSFALLGV